MWKMEHEEYEEGEAAPNATPLPELVHVHKFALPLTRNSRVVRVNMTHAL